ncbi:MAG TPA: sugar phosphate isomerase/epimerase family protein [Candidatus Lokiarchaeia archaeon]
MYKYGINLLLWTSNFTEKDLYLIKKVKDLGCDVVEIPVFNPDEFPSEKVKKELDANNLEVCVCYGCGKDSDIASLDAKIRQVGIDCFKKAIDHAVVMGAKKIGGVVYKAGGIFTGKAPTKEEWKNSVNAMKEIAKYAQKFGISICVEQINRYETYFINTTEDALKYCKEVGEPNVKLLLDSHHLILEELSIFEAIKKAGKYLGHFHTSENNRGIPGTGLVNWYEVYKALNEIKYSGWLVIESFYIGFGNIWKPVAHSPEELITKGLKNLKNFENQIRNEK